MNEIPIRFQTSNEECNAEHTFIKCLETVKKYKKIEDESYSFDKYRVIYQLPDDLDKATSTIYKENTMKTTGTCY